MIFPRLGLVPVIQSSARVLTLYIDTHVASQVRIGRFAFEIELAGVDMPLVAIFNVKVILKVAHNVLHCFVSFIVDKFNFEKK